MRTLTLRSLALSLVAVAAPCMAQAQARAKGVLVKYRDATAPTATNGRLLTASHRSLNSLGRTRRLHRVEVAEGESPEAVALAYEGMADVEYAEPNYILQVTRVSTDPLVDQEWALRNSGQSLTTPAGVSGAMMAPTAGAAGRDAGLEKAWDVITDCSAIKVAIIDTGINYAHEDLAPNLWNGGTAFPKGGFNAITGSNDPKDDNGHGSHVAGIIGAAGDNGKGGAGVCWKSSLMAIKAADSTGALTMADVVEAIDFARTSGARVINMSFGFASTTAPIALRDAIQEAGTAGILVVTAAGNDGTSNDTQAFYPCNYNLPNLLCVGAVDSTDALASFSNYSPTLVHIGAPGVNILAPWSGAETRQVLQPSQATDWHLPTAWSLRNFTKNTGGTTAILSLPADWAPNGPSRPQYAANLASVVWKNFNYVGQSMLGLRAQFNASTELGTGDGLEVKRISGSRDPFASSGAVSLCSFSTGTTNKGVSLDLSSALGSSFSLGFKFTSNSDTSTSYGVAVYDFALVELRDSPTGYRYESGTSMAAPFVTGVAAMVLAKNPQFSAAEVRESILAGGRSVPALSTKLKNGKVLSAIGALTYMRTPSNVTLTLE